MPCAWFVAYVFRVLGSSSRRFDPVLHSSLVAFYAVDVHTGWLDTPPVVTVTLRCASWRTSSEVYDLSCSWVGTLHGFNVCEIPDAISVTTSAWLHESLDRVLMSSQDCVNRERSYLCNGRWSHCTFRLTRPTGASYTASSEPHYPSTKMHQEK